jgi:hypothetical protein
MPLTTRLLHLTTRAPRRPFRQLTAYFLGLIAVGAFLVAFVPPVAAIITGSGQPTAAVGAGLQDLLVDTAPARGNFLMFDLRMLVVMAGTLLITIPFSWGYMSVRQRVGYEQSVVQTLVVLPVVVAAIMMVIQNSLALAFALGGVAAAVRFRNTLKDVADATYVFLAIGLGIAAGSGALTGALVMAAMFTYVSVALWRCNYGLCPSHATADPVPDPEETPGRSKRLRGEVILRIRDDAARTAAEDVLSTAARRWKLRKASQSPDGATLLHYDVRLKRSISPEAMAAAFGEQAPLGVGLSQFVPRTPATA